MNNDVKGVNTVPILIKGARFVDDRGSLNFCNEWSPLTAGVKRFYQVQNHRSDFIRAWHGHQKEAKFVYVAQGAALICATPLFKNPVEGGSPQYPVPIDPVMYKFVMAEDTPAILFIPAGFYNGFKTLIADTILLFFSTSTLEESKGDDIRLHWNVFGTKMWGEDYR